MVKSKAPGVSVVARGTDAEYFTVEEIEASLPSWRVEGVELTEREMTERKMPIPKQGVDGWEARAARVMISDCVRVCRVWRKRKQ